MVIIRSTINIDNTAGNSSLRTTVMIVLVNY